MTAIVKCPNCGDKLVADKKKALYSKIRRHFVTYHPFSLGGVVRIVKEIEEKDEKE